MLGLVVQMFDCLLFFTLACFNLSFRLGLIVQFYLVFFCVCYYQSVFVRLLVLCMLNCWGLVKRCFTAGWFGFDVACCVQFSLALLFGCCCLLDLFVWVWCLLSDCGLALGFVGFGVFVYLLGYFVSCVDALLMQFVDCVSYLLFWLWLCVGCCGVVVVCGFSVCLTFRIGWFLGLLCGLWFILLVVFGCLVLIWFDWLGCFDFGDYALFADFFVWFCFVCLLLMWFVGLFVCLLFWFIVLGMGLVCCFDLVLLLAFAVWCCLL